jgi:hypothetical protein
MVAIGVAFGVLSPCGNFSRRKEPKGRSSFLLLCLCQVKVTILTARDSFRRKDPGRSFDALGQLSVSQSILALAITGGFYLSYLLIVRGVLEFHEILSIHFAVTRISNCSVLLNLALVALIS